MHLRAKLLPARCSSQIPFRNNWNGNWRSSGGKSWLQWLGLSGVEMIHDRPLLIADRDESLEWFDPQSRQPAIWFEPENNSYPGILPYNHWLKRQSNTPAFMIENAFKSACPYIYIYHLFICLFTDFYWFLSTNKYINTYLYIYILIFRQIFISI